MGALIGSSGAILTHIMCEAMNRDIFDVIFGGINQAPPKPKAEGEEEPKIHRETNAEAVANLIDAAGEGSNVLIVPGYGMAAARAQPERTSLATARGVARLRRGQGRGRPCAEGSEAPGLRVRPRPALRA